METVIVRLKHEKAKKLLQHLEELNLIEVKEDTSSQEHASIKVSELKNMMRDPMDGDTIDEQMKKLRSEWERNT